MTTDYGQGKHTCYCSTEAVCKTGLGAWVDGGSCSNAACAAGTLFFCFRALSCSHWSELSEYWAGALRFPLTRRGRRRRPTSPRPRRRPQARRAPTTAWASHATSELGATLAARSGKPRAQSYRFAYNVNCIRHRAHPTTSNRPARALVFTCAVTAASLACAHRSRAPSTPSRPISARVRAPRKAPATRKLPLTPRRPLFKMKRARGAGS